MAKSLIMSKDQVKFIQAKNPDRLVGVWVDHTNGAQYISVGSCEIPVGGEIPYHIHEKEEEVMYITGGKGIAITEGVEEEIKAGDLVFMPPGLRHQFKNTGDEVLTFMFFYGPPGPEQGVKKLG
ncbi:MAG: cupin domain-containing protein [Limnochordia bacterium]|jgi:quercetin dioxygenase-like cupin family protein|nr:cupin domain-containing protein [Bacillota bacterium]